MGPTERRTINADGCSGGFIVWSGTSFASPLVAGEIAGALFEQGLERGLLPGASSCSELREDLRVRGRKAVAEVVGLSI